MSKRKEHKLSLKHTVFGYTLILTSSLGLFFIFSVLGNYILHTSQSSVLSAYLANNDQENYTRHPEDTPYPQEFIYKHHDGMQTLTPTPTPSLPPPPNNTTLTDPSSMQEIINIIDQQFNQLTPAPQVSPNPTSLEQTQSNSNTPSRNASSDINSTAHQTPNTFSQTNQNQNQQTLLSPNSIPSTQQTLNNILKDQNIHVKIENVNNQTIITATNNQGEVIHFTNDLVDKLSDLLSQDSYPKIIKLSDSNFLIKKGNAIAQSHFPLGFSSIGNVPTMSLGANDSQLTVLPDQAGHLALQTRLLNSLDKKSFFSYMFPTYSPSSPTITMNLVTLKDQPVYEISGSIEKHLFGILPIPIQKTIFVSAENGTIQEVQESSLMKFLDTLSR